jgi:hypothetical protein
MLAQLVYRKRTPSHATASLYKSKAFEEGRASAKSFQDAIRAEVNRFSRVFFVVDGIDLQSEKDRILNRLQKLPEHAQLLVTMREERTSLKEDHLSVLAIREDLELYVSSRLEQDESLGALLKQYPAELRAAIVQQVAQKAHGLYVSKLLLFCNRALTDYVISYQISFGSFTCRFTISVYGRELVAESTFPPSRNPE